MPLNRRDGSYFGTLCALDTLPATIDEANLDIFAMLASLIAFELEADEQRRQQARELEDARRAARGRERFIGLLGHELRTPLVAIKGLSQLMLRRSGLTDQSRADLQRIVSSANRLNRLTYDLLDFTRARIGGDLALTRQEIDLEQLCHQCLDDVRMEHPDRMIRLETTGDLRGTWDPDRLGQVITNLASNAVKYSPPTSPVRVLAEAEGQGVSLQVHNEGEPILPDELVHIFDPFQRGGRNVPDQQDVRGLGLGLSIVQQVVHAHGGTIEARSSAQSGTTFTVNLPHEGAPSPGINRN